MSNVIWKYDHCYFCFSAQNSEGRSVVSEEQFNNVYVKRQLENIHKRSLLANMLRIDVTKYSHVGKERETHGRMKRYAPSVSVRSEIPPEYIVVVVSTTYSNQIL